MTEPNDAPGEQGPAPASDLVAAPPAVPSVEIDLVAQRQRMFLPTLFTAVVVLALGWTGLSDHFDLATGMMLAMAGLFLFVQLMVLRRPPHIRVQGGMLFLGPVFRSPLGNVRSIAHDGSSVRVLFHDINLVEPVNAVRTLNHTQQQTGSHFVLAGFTRAQVEQLRQAIGLTLPADDPGLQIEQFGDKLRTLTPRPWVIPLMLAVNVVVFVAMVGSGVSVVSPKAAELLKWGANFAPLTTNGEAWRLLTSMFLHFGIAHLVCNLWVMRDLGMLVERLVGSVGCLLLYLISGLAGSIASLTGHLLATSAGASGAIFGLFGALMGFVLSRRSNIPMDIVRPLRTNGLIFLGINLMIGFSSPNIGMAAHLGGCAAGFLAGLLLAQSLDAETPRRRIVRNAILGVGGSVALGVMWLAVLPMTTTSREWANALDDLDKVEKEADDAYRAGRVKVQAGQMSEQDFANVINTQILPPWREITERIAAMKPLTGPAEKLRQKILEYLQANQQGYELEAKAILEKDRQTFEQAQQKYQEAQRAIQRLQEKKP